MARDRLTDLLASDPRDREAELVDAACQVALGQRLGFRNEEEASTGALAARLLLPRAPEASARLSRAVEAFLEGADVDARWQESPLATDPGRFLAWLERGLREEQSTKVGTCRRAWTSQS